ncbi:Ig-like domain-containing protein [uncultured Pseudoteredinibacter sp.]|uniref:beta strand repeat-containing protein n=1 Tax=uncultured Pseudoteredinibacter sp. TaxID=1641701 RepID=UPI002632F3F5|nr:Ig-like domain-containing protein [uncultured Pseudoteredinibacter sp.]
MLRFCLALLASLCFFTLNTDAQAQSTYRIYFDTDDNNATGCNPAGFPAVLGAEYELSIALSAAPVTVSSTELAQCSGASFGPSASVSPAALGSNTGSGGSDVIEAQLSFAQLGIVDASNVRIYFTSEGGGQADIIGAASRIDIALTPLAPTAVPTLGWLALAMGVLLFVSGRKHLPKRLPQLAVFIIMLPLLSIPLAWAVVISVDGLTSDWSSVSSAGTDPADDAGSAAADLQAAFLTDDGRNLYLRLDVNELENQSPVVSALSFSVPEDIAQSLALSASDPEGQNLSFTIASGPSNGSLSAVSSTGSDSASVSYTSDLNYVGSDSFTIEVSDGSSSSTATVNITVTPVNDAPTLSGSANNQSATGNVFIEPGSANSLRSGLTIVDPDSNSFSVSLANTAGTNSLTTSNGATVTLLDSNSGTYRYNPAAGYNGTDSFSYYICDNANACTQASAVSVTVSDRIWFVDSSASTAGDGRLSSPFQKLSGSNSFGSDAADSTGDTIYLRGGNYQGELALKNGQKLIGSMSNSTLASISGITLASHSGSIDNPDNSNTIISNASGNAVSIAQNNLIHGIEIGDAINKVIGTGFGNLEVKVTEFSGAGRILALSTGTVDINVSSMQSTSSSSQAISFINVDGNVVAGLASSIAGANLNAVDLSDATNLNFSFAGTINSSGQNNLAIRANNISAGTLLFSGNLIDDGNVGGGVEFTNSSATLQISSLSKQINTASNRGIYINNNTGGQFQMSNGGLQLQSSSGLSAEFFNGGTVEITGPNNTINTSTGTAISVVNTNIASNNLNFQSISSSGAANTIFLNNTGGAGGLVVTGTEGNLDANYSGGRISNSSSSAIFASNTANLSLRDMRIENSTLHHLDATSVTGLSLEAVDFDTAGVGAIGEGAIQGSQLSNLSVSNSRFNAGGNSASEHGFVINNLFGNSTIQGSQFTNSATLQFYINNTSNSGGTDTVNFLANQFSSHNGIFFGDHLSIEAGGTSNMLVNIGDGSTANRNSFDTGQDGVQAVSSSTGQLEVHINNNLRTNGTGTGFNVGAFNASRINFTIQNNQITDTGSTGINANSANTTNASNILGLINNNTVSRVGRGGTGFYISNVIEGAGNGIVEIKNNVLSGGTGNPNINGDSGIRVQARDPSNQGSLSMDVTIEGNTVSGTGFRGIEVESGSSAGGTGELLCLNISNNNSTTASGDPGYRLRQRPGTTFNLDGFIGNGTSSGDISTHINTTKSNTGTTSISIGSAFSAASCSTLP